MQFMIACASAVYNGLNGCEPLRWLVLEEPQEDPSQPYSDFKMWFLIYWGYYIMYSMEARLFTYLLWSTANETSILECSKACHDRHSCIFSIFIQTPKQYIRNDNILVQMAYFFALVFNHRRFMYMWIHLKTQIMASVCTKDLQTLK